MNTQKFFELIPSGTKINFVGRINLFFGISVVLMVVSLFLIFTRGLNYGVDFTGGTQVHMRLPAQTTAQDVRNALTTIGLEGAMVQGYGDRNSGEFLIRAEVRELNLQTYKAQIEGALKKGTVLPRIRYSEDRMYISYGEPIDPAFVTSAIQKAGISGLLVESATPFGKASDHEYLVQFEGIANRILHAMENRFGKAKVELLQAEQVGPKVGKELRMQAVGAVLISIVLILIYVWFRFEFEFAPGAAISLLHDAIVVLGAFSLFQFQFDLSIVAAILTIIGFSINDTIVVYDRVRENIRKMKEPDFRKVINESINQTLSRTILTSGTVFIAAMTLLFLGGPITYNFAMAFTIGVVFGVYSSIFVAVAVTIYFHNYLTKRKSLA